MSSENNLDIFKIHMKKLSDSDKYKEQPTEVSILNNTQTIETEQPILTIESGNKDKSTRLNLDLDKLILKEESQDQSESCNSSQNDQKWDTEYLLKEIEN